MGGALEEAGHRLVRFFEGAGLWWGVVISVALALASAVLGVAIVLGWSVDHFKEGTQRTLWRDRHPAVRLVGLAGKNLAGVVLFVVGLIMALPGIPGQGILTMIVAVTLIDFPGKRGLERRLIGRPWVLRQLNRLRARFGRAPLQMS
jgi:hypothetical protein